MAIRLAPALMTLADLEGASKRLEEASKELFKWLMINY